MLKLINRVFSSFNQNKKVAELDPDDQGHDHDPPKEEKEILEIDTPVFKINREMSFDEDGNREYSCKVVIIKPNCCFICKEAIEDELFANLKYICQNWKGWNLLSSEHERVRLQVVGQLIGDQIKNPEVRYRRYCYPCIIRTFITQLQDSRAVTYSHQSYYHRSEFPIKFRCQFCSDIPKNKRNQDIGHDIREDTVANLIKDYSLHNVIYFEEYQKARKLFIAHHDITNQFCPVVDCPYFIKKTNTTTRVSCPDHGSYCIKCAEKCKENEKHNCRGIEKELSNIKNMKRCPTCLTIITKNEGCDNMTCSCGHNFKWTKVDNIVVRPRRRKPKFNDAKDSYNSISDESD